MIKSISYLTAEDERKHILCIKGKFHLTKKAKGLSISSRIKAFTASDFIKYMRRRDPYITLDNGEKFRVFRGGDPDNEIIEIISLVETHDEKTKETIIPDFPFPGGYHGF